MTLCTVIDLVLQGSIILSALFIYLTFTLFILDKLIPNPAWSLRFEEPKKYILELEEVEELKTQRKSELESNLKRLAWI